MREPAQTLVGELERIVSALPDAVLFPGLGAEGQRRFAAAMGVPPVPHRVEGDESATTTIGAVPGCSYSRTISGLKFVSDDCGQSIDDSRSPACQSRSPTKSTPVP